MKNSKFIDQFATFAGKLGNQIHLKTLRDAFVTVMPLYILAGLIVLRYDYCCNGWLFLS